MKTLEKMTKKELILEAIRLQGEQKEVGLIASELMYYISSDKFQSNCNLSGYVNVNDIKLRLNELTSKLSACW
jgi:hypothetical protein